MSAELLPILPDDPEAIRKRLREAVQFLPGGRRLLDDAELGLALRVAAYDATLVISGLDEDGVSVARAHEALRRTTSRRTLLLALQAVVGNEPLRLCGRCGQDLLVSQFSKSARYCKPCERRRVKLYTQGKRREAWEAAQAPAPQAPALTPAAAPSPPAS